MPYLELLEIILGYVAFFIFVADAVVVSLGTLRVKFLFFFFFSFLGNLVAKDYFVVSFMLLLLCISQNCLKVHMYIS